MQWPARLRAKLDWLRPIEVGRGVFGVRRAKQTAARELPVFDPLRIARLEADIGVSLPADLRLFLQTVHGGGPGPGYGLSVQGDARAALPFPYGRADFEQLLVRRRTDRHASLPLTDDNGDDWPPGSGFVVLTEIGCGVHDVVVTTGELRGSVWCCDMEWRPWLEGESLLTFVEWYERWLDGALARPT